MNPELPGTTPESAPMTVGSGVPREVALAGLVRLVQWQLNDVAADLPSGRLFVEQRDEVASSLETLAELVRQQPGR